MDFLQKVLNLPRRNLPRIFPNLFPSPESQSRRLRFRIGTMQFLSSVVKSSSAFNARRIAPIVSVPLAMTFLTISINSWVNFDQAQDAARNSEFSSLDPKCRFSTYDFIVVGGGTAGIVVAKRLAKASNRFRVLLLEAGGEPNFLNDVPFLDFYLSNQPANTWMYKTTPQLNSSYGCDGRRASTTRGKMLGGSSSTNFMLYARGNKEDFNQWTKDANDEKWGYEFVLPYFMKSEDYRGAYENDDLVDEYHGKGGFYRISTNDFMPGVEEFLAAGVEKGFNVGDYNGANQSVFSKIDVTTRDGWRESTYHAFYRNVQKPQNLCIKKYAHVTKINFASKDGIPRAVGVTYQRQGAMRYMKASKEVIVSAGTLGSPKLLMLSGIGPKDDLQDLGIPALKDLPVGENLQDHVLTLAGPFLKGPSLYAPQDFTVYNIGKFALNGDGSPAAPAGFSGHAFFQSPFAKPSYPDVQIIPFSFTLYPELPHHLSLLSGVREELLTNWLKPYLTQRIPSKIVAVILTRPKSVGKLSLQSTDPEDDLLIDPRYLSHPDDSDALLWAFEKVVDLYENSSALNAPLFPKPLPGCENELSKRDYYRCFIKYISSSFYHHVGTCALGQVVDNRLRVKGVDALRVIDASIIPRAPSANTCAPTLMVAEKGADLILEDYLLDSGGWPMLLNLEPFV